MADPFAGLDAARRQAKAEAMARAELRDFDTSLIPPRGEAEAGMYFELEGNRQAAKLRAMLEAGKHDPDYWRALNLICARLHERGQPLPEPLRAWAASMHKGELEAPGQHRGNEGLPPYAYLARDMAWAWAFAVLVEKGLPRMDAYAAVASAAGAEPDTVRRAIRKMHKRPSVRVPAPWEVWEPIA